MHSKHAAPPRRVRLQGTPVEPPEQPGPDDCASFKAGVVVCVDGRQSPAFAALLRVGGMELVTRRELPPEKSVTIRLPVPGAGRMQLDAITRWQRRFHEGGGTFLTSLEFRSLTPAQLACLTRWIAHTHAPPIDEPDDAPEA